MKAELENLRESSQSKANSLASTLAEHDELKERLHREQERMARLELDIEVWSIRNESLPKSIVAHYVKAPEFWVFLTQLVVGNYRVGTLAFREAVLKSNLTSVVEVVDDEVLAL